MNTQWDYPYQFWVVQRNVRCICFRMLWFVKAVWCTSLAYFMASHLFSRMLHSLHFLEGQGLTAVALACLQNWQTELRPGMCPRRGVWGETVSTDVRNAINPMSNLHLTAQPDLASAARLHTIAKMEKCMPQAQAIHTHTSHPDGVLFFCSKYPDWVLDRRPKDYHFM